MSVIRSRAAFRKTILLTTLAVLPPVALQAAPKKPAKKTISSKQITRKPNYIVGRAVNWQGKPLANVRIRVYGMTDAGHKGSIRTKTNAQGIYSLRLPPGNYSLAEAQYDVNFNGKMYALPLHPTDGAADDFDSRQGAVENLVLKISGLNSSLKDREEERSYYGGWIVAAGGRLANGNYLDGYDYRFPAGSSLELTLTPKGKLIDGSTGKILKMRKSARATMRFIDIPIGLYTVTAKQINADGTEVPLRVAASMKFATPEAPDFAASTTIYFPPQGDVAIQTPGAGQVNFYAQP